MDVSDAVWRWVQTLHSIKKICSYLAVNGNVWWYRRNDEWEWWIIKVGASKIWNEPNHRKFTFDWKTTAPTLLLPIMFNWIDKTMNDIDEVWRWVHQKYGMSQIVQKLHSILKTDLILLLQMMFDWIYKTMNESDAE